VTTVPGWPQDLVNPSSSEFEFQSVRWLLDRLPDVFRSPGDQLDPVALVWVLEGLIDAQVVALRQMFGTARTQDGVTDITVLMDGIARAGASLVRIQREVKLVKSALATLGRANGESLLD
jgi:hypothetical protein